MIKDLRYYIVKQCIAAGYFLLKGNRKQTNSFCHGKLRFKRSVFRGKEKALVATVFFYFSNMALKQTCIFAAPNFLHCVNDNFECVHVFFMRGSTVDVF